MKITYTTNLPKSDCSGEYIWRRSCSKKKQERGGPCLDQTYFAGLRYYLQLPECCLTESVSSLAFSAFI